MKKRKLKNIKETKKDSNVRNENSESYSLISKSNKNFQLYYKLQNLSNIEEFEEFIKFLSIPLPTSLRINQSHPLYALVLFIFKEFLIKYNSDNSSKLLKEINFNEKCICFLIYNYSRNLIKKEIAFKDLYKFIVSQDDYGTISSQELVSMLPCICLDIQPNHSILDICAAPGSKSVQILDTMLCFNDNLIGNKLLNGVFIANDVSMKRIDTLITRINRIPSPSTLITCIDSSYFPKFISKKSKNYFQFDRILVDVPCTSDGTIRKNIDIWENWQVNKALYLHKKQLSIVSRAFNLLKSGGRLIYSTCSFNPIENEAIVSTILEQFPDSKLIYPFQLKDSLKFSSGLKTWSVYSQDENSNLELHTSYENISENFKKMIFKSMFPTKKWIENEYYKSCFRILPNMNNSGGFFFAIIGKEDKHKEILDDFVHENKKNFEINTQYECVDFENWSLISKFFGFNSQENLDLSNFPIEIQQHFNNIQNIDQSYLIIKKDCKKKIYIINESILNLLKEYDLRINLKFIGTRAFEYYKGQISGNAICTWRITQIASSYLIRFIKRRVIFTSISLIDLISNEKNDIKGSEILNLINNNEIIGLKELCFNNNKLECGCILIVINPPNIIHYNGEKKINPYFKEFKQGIILSATIYQDFGINLFVSKNELESIKSLVFINI